MSDHADGGPKNRLFGVGQRTSESFVENRKVWLSLFCEMEVQNGRVQVPIQINQWLSPVHNRYIGVQLIDVDPNLLQATVTQVRRAVQMNSETAVVGKADRNSNSKRDPITQSFC
jgi:hypothetical protein